ncbi:MAG: multidrug efflux RND transporter permease subunit [Planctomycetia bacterium]|nr:multidrug efflux RND transporter permease subunit [Planctomycetia bacterium]
MISRFFIDRPIFASVLSIVITLGGAISVFTLPLAQFPPVSPPTVSVSCNYPGASARDVAGSVAAPIEQQVNGVEGMLYMSSSCANDGSYGLSVVFKHGINLNMAQVLVQNRVSLALPSLPEVIKQTGVTVRKRSPDAVMGIAITSPSGRYDQLYLSNFALMRVRDELLRIEGVADLYMNGQRDYSIRIWVDPTLLAARSLTASDVVRAIREQNAQVATGLIGNPPIRSDQTFEITLSTLGRLDNVEQFENIIIKSTSDGRLVRIKDIGRVELGAKSQDVSVLFDGKTCVFMPIFQLPDANALDVHDRVLAKMQDISQNFPDGVEWEVNFDTTPYTRESINEVFKALRDAVILVAVVVLVFLQNWRSALIPLVAVPVAIIGTFAAMAAFGFSLNNLTLFGLVLAIGIVVDDAIVVVEAVEHHIENGMAPREATILAMQQVSGPVVAVALVLSAVFVPCAFITGITGQFFRQFALTISVSTIISAFNSLTLSPALTALLLRPRGEQTAPPLPWMAFALAGGWFGWVWLTPHLVSAASPDLPQSAIPWAAAAAGAIAGVLVSWPINLILGFAFRAFNRGFDLAGSAYTWIIGKFLHVSVLVLVVYGGLLALTYRDFMHTPKGFIPSQDMGYLLVNVQLPDSASDERTSQVIRKIEKIAASTPGIKHATGITGQSFALNAYGSNFGSLFIGLDDYHKRRDPSVWSPSIVAKLNESFTHLPEAMVQVFPPPPVRGVGRAGGFTLMVEDRSSLGLTTLQEQTENLVRSGNDRAELTSLFTVFRANVPMLKVEPDARECMGKGVNLRDFSDTLQVYQGSLYVNDFNWFGRTWQVIVQAQQQFRDQLEDIPKLMVRNAAGTMVPLGSLANIRQINGPLVLTRYNMYPAASITGAGKPGVSSRDAINLMARLAHSELPKSMAFEWTEMAYLELMAGNTAMVLFGFAVVMVFLVLAAQYESWSLPLAVILVVPMCLFSAIIGVNLAKMDINIFTQIGFVVLVGLASKNAILIVEFAKIKRDSGESRRQATLEACRLRLRPIVMTSFAFILGVAPLMLAHGAGAEMRRALGTAVFSGMLGVTLFGIFLTPIFFSTIDWLGGTPLFASRLVRGAGALSLGMLTLRPLRKLASRLGTERHKPPRPKAPAPSEPALHK